MTIPANAIVSVNPGVVSSGGSALALNGVILIDNVRAPVGTVLSFPSAEAVADYFGANAAETALAQNYFLGFDNSTIKPGALLMARYTDDKTQAWVLGRSLAGVNLNDIQNIQDDLDISFMLGGKQFHDTVTPSMWYFESFSEFAEKLEESIQKQSGQSGITITFDSQTQAFLLKADDVGEDFSELEGSLLPVLGFDKPIISPSAETGDTPQSIMNTIKRTTQNWGAFTTAFPLTVPDRLAFATWANSQNNRYAYVMWETETADSKALEPGAGFATPQIIDAGYSGIVPIWGNATHAAAFLGMVASIDFTRKNGRITFAFKSQSGLTPAVTDQTTGDSLLLKGYNFYGAYATANDRFNFFYNGQITGPFKWADAYVNQIRLNSQLQLANMVLLTNTNSIPYNADGYALITAACMDPINEAINFGSIRPGVALSMRQAAQVNNAAGTDISATLSQRGWYLQVLDPGAQVRGERGSPVITLWYTDGGAVQKIVIASIDVQ